MQREHGRHVLVRSRSLRCEEGALAPPEGLPHGVSAHGVSPACFVLRRVASLAPCRRQRRLLGCYANEMNPRVPTAVGPVHRSHP